MKQHPFIYAPAPVIMLRRLLYIIPIALLLAAIQLAETVSEYQFNRWVSYFGEQVGQVPPPLAVAMFGVDGASAICIVLLLAATLAGIGIRYWLCRNAQVEQSGDGLARG